MGSIIDNVEDLLKLSSDELDEVLLSDKYNNKALLRELIRRSLSTAKTYKNAFEYEQQKAKDFSERVKNVINQLEDIDTDL